MSIEILQQRVAEYACNTALEEENAIKEITQEVILMALSRSGFFDEAEFHGGTALRVLYGLPRFSEDLDFALLQSNAKFNWAVYLDKVANELLSFGYDIEITDRKKTDNAVKKAFLKDNSIGKLLQLQFPQPDRARKKVKIKLEIDTNPPLGSSSEFKYLDFPLAFSIRSQEVSSSFSGKLHALLCRQFTKGRDWYDFSWYVMHKSNVNYNYLRNALVQVGPYQGKKLNIDKQWLLAALGSKINSIDWQAARADVNRFVKPNEYQSIELWSDEFFMSRLNKLEEYLQ